MHVATPTSYDGRDKINQGNNDNNQIYSVHIKAIVEKLEHFSSP
jgi:hypothetical protein